jgi:Holliday junction resolvase
MDKNLIQVSHILFDMSTVFEREIKGILEGDDKILQRIVHTCDSLAQASYEKIKTKPFVVIRSAGSFGVDIVAIRGDISFPIEVKSSVENVIHLNSPRLVEQIARLKNICIKAGLTPIYAFRLKSARGDAWRIFTIEMSGLSGVQKILHNRLPKMTQTTGGNYMMRWDEGMPLHKFIEYLSI